MLPICEGCDFFDVCHTQASSENTLSQVSYLGKKDIRRQLLSLRSQLSSEIDQTDPSSEGRPKSPPSPEQKTEADVHLQTTSSPKSSPPSTPPREASPPSSPPKYIKPTRAILMDTKNIKDVQHTEIEDLHILLNKLDVRNTQQFVGEKYGKMNGSALANLKLALPRIEAVHDKVPVPTGLPSSSCPSVNILRFRVGAC